MTDLVLYAQGTHALLHPKRFKAVLKLGDELGQQFTGFEAHGRTRQLDTLGKWVAKNPYDLSLTGPVRPGGEQGAVLSATRTGYLRGLLTDVKVSPATTVAAFAAVCTAGRFYRGSLRPDAIELDWKRRGELGYGVSDPGWLMFFGDRILKFIAPRDFAPDFIAKAVKPGILFQLAAAPEQMTQARLEAFEQRLFATVRKRQRKLLGYDFPAVVQGALGKTLAAHGMKPFAHENPTRALFRGGRRGAQFRIDEEGEYGVRIELEYFHGQSNYVHWPEKPKAHLPPRTNAWVKKKDVERYLAASEPAVARACDVWFAKMDAKFPAS